MWNPYLSGGLLSHAVPSSRIVLAPLGLVIRLLLRNPSVPPRASLPPHFPKHGGEEEEDGRREGDGSPVCKSRRVSYMGGTGDCIFPFWPAGRPAILPACPGALGICKYRQGNLGRLLRGGAAKSCCGVV